MEKMEKFKQLLTIVQDSVTKEEFLKNFKIIIDLIKELKRTNALEMSMIENRYADKVNQIEKDCQGDMAQMKKQAMDYCQREMRTIMAEHKSRMTEIGNKMAELNAIKLPSAQEIAQLSASLAITELQPKIPTLEAIEENLFKSGDLIANSLEALTDGNKLKISAIENLQEILDELRQLRTRTLGGGGFNYLAMTQHIIPWTETSVAPNGVLTDFVIGYAPNPANSLEVMVDNSPLFETSDWTYTASTRTLSFLVAPPNGAKIRYKCLV